MDSGHLLTDRDLLLVNEATKELRLANQELREALNKALCMHKELVEAHGGRKYYGSVEEFMADLRRPPAI